MEPLPPPQTFLEHQPNIFFYFFNWGKGARVNVFWGGGLEKYRVGFFGQNKSDISLRLLTWILAILGHIAVRGGFRLHKIARGSRKNRQPLTVLFKVGKTFTPLLKTGLKPC